MVGLHRVVGGVVASAVLAIASSAVAQPTQPTAGAPSQRPRPVLEGALGWAGFGDEGVIHHSLVGVGYRHYLSRLISLGPEVQFMAGPGSDHDLIVTGNVMVDLLGPTADRPRRTTPFVVAGGGLFRHSDRFGTEAFSSTEGAFTGGLGVRTWIGERAFIAADARVGWELHLRVAALVGVALN